MSLLKEFRDFAMRGNVVDMAVGVVIGGAFGKIVTSLVGDIIMPAIGRLGGTGDLSKLEFELVAATETAKAVVIRYGAFAQTIVDFTLIAASIFLVIKLMNSLKRKQEEAPSAPAPTPEDIQLLREIRDELRNR